MLTQTSADNPLRFDDLTEAWAFVRSNPGYGYPVPNSREHPTYWLVPRTVGVVNERLAAEAQSIPRLQPEETRWRRR